MTAVGARATAGAIEQSSAAKLQFSGLLEGIAPTLETLNIVVPLIPPALGSEPPRTYSLMFQNPAESRASGCTALSLAVFKVGIGRIELTETKPAGFENLPVLDESVIHLSEGAEAVDPGFLGTFIANASSRPSFTTSATITQETWIRAFGYPLDGVLSIDPVALSSVLRSTDPNKLLGGFAQGGDERRPLHWSAKADEQAQLAAAGLNGESLVSEFGTERVGLYFHDNVGSKPTCDLKQAVNLSEARCRDNGRQSNRVSVDITDAVDPATTELLSISIVGNWKKGRAQRGAQRLVVLLYAPAGAQITSAVVGGAPVELTAVQDAEFLIGKVVVTVPPGETVNITYDFVSTEPGEKALEAQMTPMATATPIETVLLDCATVPAE